MAGISLTAVVLLFIIPMAISSAMTPATDSAGVSPGMAIMSSPTEHTHVMASSFSNVRAPASTASIMPWSSLTGMNAPLKPPTYELAITPPFFTWSLRSASAAVVPGAPGYSSPISCNISATLSPTAGVGASDRSTIPKGTPSCDAASRATSCPTRVILNAVFFMVSQSTSKSAPLAASNAFFTTPGPLTPTLMTDSPSVIPWNAPAIKGLSSGALQNTTSFAAPKLSVPYEALAVSSTISPMRLTASILIPVRDEPTLTELHTRLVTLSASGMELRNISSLSVLPFASIAE